MSKTQTTKRYFKLGPAAESYFDPITRMKISRGRMGMIEPPATMSKSIQNAIKGGQIVEVRQEEYLAFQAAQPKNEKVSATSSEGASKGQIEAARREGFDEGFLEGAASVIPADAIGETMPGNMKAMSIVDLKLAAVKLNDLTLESVQDVLGMGKKAEVIAFIEAYFEEEAGDEGKEDGEV